MTRSRLNSNRPADRGYSLIEVMIAAGILGGVLISISSMFIAGTQSVRSGRDMTRATTIASSAMEDVMTLPFDLVYSLTGADRSAETGVWDTTLPIPVLSGSAEDVFLMTTLLDSWAEQVESELGSGELTYQVDGIVRLPSAGVEDLGSFNESTYLRVRITVTWIESRGRNRHVTFEGLVV